MKEETNRKTIMKVLLEADILSVKQLRAIENALALSESFDKILNESLGIEDNGFGLMLTLSECEKRGWTWTEKKK